MVLLSNFVRVKRAVGNAPRLTSLRDEWRRMTYPTAHLTDVWSRKRVFRYVFRVS